MFISKIFESAFPFTDYIIVDYGENIQLINIAIPKGAYCGLYIFLQNISVTKKQKDFIDRLRKKNYCSCVCDDFEKLLEYTAEYLTGKDWSDFQHELNDYIASKYITTK